MTNEQDLPIQTKIEATAGDTSVIPKLTEIAKEYTAGKVSFSEMQKAVMAAQQTSESQPIAMREYEILQVLNSGAPGFEEKYQQEKPLYTAQHEADQISTIARFQENMRMGLQGLPLPSEPFPRQPIAVPTRFSSPNWQPIDTSNQALGIEPPPLTPTISPEPQSTPLPAPEPEVNAPVEVTTSEKPNWADIKSILERLSTYQSLMAQFPPELKKITRSAASGNWSTAEAAYSALDASAHILLQENVGGRILEIQSIQPWKYLQQKNECAIEKLTIQLGSEIRCYVSLAPESQTNAHVYYQERNDSAVQPLRMKEGSQIQEIELFPSYGTPKTLIVQNGGEVERRTLSSIVDEENNVRKMATPPTPELKASQIMAYIFVSQKPLLSESTSQTTPAGETTLLPSETKISEKVAPVTKENDPSDQMVIPIQSVAIMEKKTNAVNSGYEYLAGTNDMIDNSTIAFHFYDNLPFKSHDGTRPATPEIIWTVEGQDGKKYMLTYREIKKVAHGEGGRNYSPHALTISSYTEIDKVDPDRVTPAWLFMAKAVPSPDALTGYEQTTVFEKADSPTISAELMNGRNTYIQNAISTLGSDQFFLALEQLLTRGITTEFSAVDANQKPSTQDGQLALAFFYGTPKEYRRQLAIGTNPIPNENGKFLLTIAAGKLDQKTTKYVMAYSQIPHSENPMIAEYVSKLKSAYDQAAARNEDSAQALIDFANASPIRTFTPNR